MEKRRKGREPSIRWLKCLPFVLLLLVSTLQGVFCELSFTPSKKKSTQPPPGSTPTRSTSSFVFPVAGNVYPLGYYSVSLTIGSPPKVFELDIDTGSDITWVQCDAPCTGCTKPRDQLYKPKDNLVSCADPLCSAVNSPRIFPCASPNDQCDYEIDYADEGSSLGVLVSDLFRLQLTNGSQLRAQMTFGCGYDQRYHGLIPPPATCGVLGLGNGKASFISQLKTAGLTKNVFGHCLSGKGGGFLFFGNQLVPSSGIVWTLMASGSLDKHYSSEPADLLFGGRPTRMKGLYLVFDSGSSYTYFNAQLYQTILNLRTPLKDAPEEKALSMCWKGKKPFKSVHDVKNYFKPLALSFTKSRKSQLQLHPEDYLIVTEHGNVCVGILNGTQVGLANLNVIGDIFLQDKLVVYDNERQRIGWASANCHRIPNVDGDYNEGFCQPYAANYNILQEQQCPSAHFGKINILLGRESFAPSKRKK